MLKEEARKAGALKSKSSQIVFPTSSVKPRQKAVQGNKADTLRQEMKARQGPFFHEQLLRRLN